MARITPVLEPVFFLQFFVVVCLIQAIAASARHEPEDTKKADDLGYNDKRKADEYKTYIALNLLGVMDFLQKASKVNNPGGNDVQCRKSVDAVLNSTPWVQILVLNDSYEDAIHHLRQATNILSNCSELRLPDSVGVSEAVLDFTNQASKHLYEASVFLDNLQQLRKKIIEVEKNPRIGQLQEEGSDQRQGCPVDRTKCQFSLCGKGKSLPSCATGFAAGVTGGKDGQSYTVTSPDDNMENPSPGTLRYAVSLASSNTEPKGGVWITFSHDMLIRLGAMLWVRSHTTIDGRGVNVTVTGKNMVLAGAHNVILHNFQINDIHDSDTVHIFSRATMVWIDHVTSFDGKLGLVSVIQGSTDVTISNCYLSNKNFNMLLGASDLDTIDQNMRVTVYRNWFRDSRQRMPHCRWGYCHVINNLYSNWGYYAIGGRVHAKIYSEKNVFSAGDKQEVTPWYRGYDSSFDTTASIQSRKDLFLNGATFHQFLRFGGLQPPAYTHFTDYPPIHPTVSLADLVEHCSGALHGSKLYACLALG